MRIWLAILFAIMLLPVPARAVDSAYRYCRIGEGPTKLVRTIRADGSFAFQSSDGPGIAKPGKTGLRAYLAWPESAAQAPLLRIVHGEWDGAYSVYVPDDAELGFTGADKPEDRSLATVIPNGDFTLFDLDPRALLDRFRGLKHVALRIHARGKKDTIVRSEIDLDVLRSTLAEATVLAASETSAPSCGAAPSDLTEERDIAFYTDCRADLHDATGGYWATVDRVTWQYRFSARLWLDADTIGHWQIDGDFAGRMERPFGPSSPFALRLVSDDPGVGQTVTIVVGDKRTVMRANYYEQVPWADLMQAAAPIVIELRDAKGNVTERDTVPADWFRMAEKNLLATYGRVSAKLRDPMRFCAPPQDIVIT